MGVPIMVDEESAGGHACLRSNNSHLSHLTDGGLSIPGEQEVSSGHGPKKGLQSVTSATFLLCCLSLGVGVFQLPTVLNSTGWVVGLGLIGVFGVLTMLLQLQLLSVAVERNVRTWEELAILAPFGKALSSVSLFLSLIIGNAAHIQVVAGMLFDLMSYFVGDDYQRTDRDFTTLHRIVLYCLFLAFACPYCFGDDLGALSNVGKSVAAVVLSTCLAVIIFSVLHINEGKGAAAQGHSTEVGCPGGMEAILQQSPNICFAFTGMLNFWEVFAALKRGAPESAEKKMRASVWTSSILVLAVYLFLTVAALVAFGTQVKDNVLYNFPVHNDVITMLSFAVVVVIVLDYPVLNFPLVEMCRRSQTLKLGDKPWARVVLTLIFMVIVILLDTAVPDMKDIFGLCGALGLSTYCCTLPGLILVFASRNPIHKITGVVSVILGLMMLFGGTFFIIRDIVHPPKTNPSMFFSSMTQ
mmetsp:Transcript_51518/g.111867  ORF Transcript_51518/g.111867 Transcript_51518/m.111867 type:complete len:469 (-) Transcript_51518:384-1790(-)